MTLLCITGTTGPLGTDSAQELPVLTIAVGASVGACLLVAMVVVGIVVVVVVHKNRKTSSFSPREDSDGESGRVSTVDRGGWPCT